MSADRTPLVRILTICKFSGVKLRPAAWLILRGVRTAIRAA